MEGHNSAQNKKKTQTRVIWLYPASDASLMEPFLMSYFPQAVSETEI
jgi:hypothetical protein